MDGMKAHREPKISEFLLLYNHTINTLDDELFYKYQYHIQYALYLFECASRLKNLFCFWAVRKMTSPIRISTIPIT